MLEHLVDISFKDSEPMMETKKKTAITREWNKFHACRTAKLAKEDENKDEDAGSVASDVDEWCEEFIEE